MPNQEYVNGITTATQIQVDGIMLNELVNGSRGLEFSIETPPLCEEKLEDLRIDSAYEYEQYADHINLDCLDQEDDINTSPFAVIAKNMIDIIPDGGVKKLIRKAELGTKIPEKALVYLHYNMYLELEEVPFDSSYLRSSKHSFKHQMGNGSVLPGFEIAVASMAQGEKSHFLIQPKYAFREMGVPPRIPPNAAILLEVDVIKVVNCGETFDELTDTGDYEDLKSFSVAFKKAKAWQLRGNNNFHTKNFKSALDCYKKAVALLMNCSLMNDKEESDQKSLLIKVYVNQCICYNKLNMPQKVCLVARDAVQYDPLSANYNSKLHFNWGKALACLSEFSRAAHHYRKALSLSPDCSEISAELVKLEEKKKQHDKHEKIFFKKACGLNKEMNGTNNTSSDDVLDCQEHQGLIKEVEDFAKSSRSRLELPKGLTRVEDQVVIKTAKNLNLVYNEKCRAITKL